jgi:hypothetical protein
MNTKNALDEAKADLERLRQVVKQKYAGQFRPLVDPLQDMENRFYSLKESVIFRLSLKNVIEIPKDDELTLEERAIFRQFRSCVETADLDFSADSTQATS